MKKRLSIVCVCLLSMMSQAFAEQQTVTLGASLFPPSAYINKSTGQCVGENIDVARKVLSDYNIKLEVVCALPIRMYRLVEHAEVDFTVNVKHTRALKPHVAFVEPPLKQLVINLYRHGNVKEVTTIAAIRGFDYDGTRNQLIEQNYRFIDLPTAEAALQLFMKGRSDALISYQSNVLHIKQQNGIVFPAEITASKLHDVNAYFAIAKGSKHFDLLMHAFNDYAEQHQLAYFVQALTESRCEMASCRDD
ncbi:transporter substrate-binding domain-containing protein [Aestuariibacter halophilus]|uniref:Transporter substrate-binding domain-containing protein n=1 Tax=Fluctibacter halophilus TaxID=226011 RepID=A0ABS8G7P7_9ALTE|nr:transporter substrate-binding domain-containing protein [Aestuariibacter halophilus]MCC2616166.1 transporter substrate-binding domain-containing protein [Aestuariibacter halophilus]